MVKKYTEKVTSDYFRFGDEPAEREKDDDANYTKVLAGILRSKGYNRNGSGSYKIEQENGELVKFSGTVDLDDKLELVEIGDDIQITLVGERKSDTKGHSATKLFEVMRA